MRDLSHAVRRAAAKCLFGEPCMSVVVDACARTADGIGFPLPWTEQRAVGRPVDTQHDRRCVCPGRPILLRQAEYRARHLARGEVHARQSIDQSRGNEPHRPRRDGNPGRAFANGRRPNLNLTPVAA